MQIIPSTKRGYAYIVWTKEDKEDIRELQKSMLPDGSDIPSLDFWDEISKNELIPDKPRPRSGEGKCLR
jgi:hypothetical protein